MSNISIQGSGGGGGGRAILTGNLSLYVSTTGSDSNDGLTIGTAFATVQHALDLIAENYFLFYANVFISIQPGSGYDGWNVTGIQTAGIITARDDVVSGYKGFVLIIGDDTDNTAVTISGINGQGEAHYCIGGYLSSVGNAIDFFYCQASVSFDSLTIDVSKYEEALVSTGANVLLFIGGGYSNSGFGILPSSGVRFLAGDYPIGVNSNGTVLVDTVLYYEAGHYQWGFFVDNGCSIIFGQLAGIVAESGATWDVAFAGLADDQAGGLINMGQLGGVVTDNGAVGPKFAVNGPNALLALPGDLNFLPGNSSGIITNGGFVSYISDIDSNVYAMGANCTETFNAITNPLPAAPLAYQGMRAFVDDALGPVFGAAYAGGGAAYASVIYLNGAWQFG